MKKSPSLANERTFGVHHLGVAGVITTVQQLEDAVNVAAMVGAKAFELVCSPFCTIPAETVAGVLRHANIKKLAYCVVFTEVKTTKEGMYAPNGDPLSQEPEEVERAKTAFGGILCYLASLRMFGIEVTCITGPSCFVLGRKYNDSATATEKKPLRTRSQLNRAIADFYRPFTAELEHLGITVCIEYLRDGEDCGALTCVETVLDIIKLLGGVESPFKVHFDFFHARERGHDPIQALLKASASLGHVHAHGAKRIAPGANTRQGEETQQGLKDDTDWHLVAETLNDIEYTGLLIAEPFCLKARADIPVLGEGLPPAEEPIRYYLRAAATLAIANIT